MHNRKKGRERGSRGKKGRREEEREGRKSIPGIMAERYLVRNYVCN